MVFMYGLNAKLKGWWKEVNLIVWGPSSRLLTEDRELQEELAKMKEAGVELQACRRCAELYGVDRQLEEMGIEVIFMGVPLTEKIKEDAHIITF